MFAIVGVAGKVVQHLKASAVRVQLENRAQIAGTATIRRAVKSIAAKSDAAVDVLAIVPGKTVE